MTANTTMTIHINPEVKEKLGRLANDTRRTRSFLAAEAVAAYVDCELDIVEGIKRGLANVEAGRVVRHSQVVAEARAVIADQIRTSGR